MSERPQIGISGPFIMPIQVGNAAGNASTG
jgi:hypothetical protein